MQTMNRFLDFANELIAKYHGLSEAYGPIALIYPEEEPVKEQEAIQAQKNFVTNLYHIQNIREENYLYTQNLTFLTNLLEKKVYKQLYPSVEKQVEKIIREEFHEAEKHTVENFTKLIQRFVEREGADRLTFLKERLLKEEYYTEKKVQKEQEILFRKLENIYQNSVYRYGTAVSATESQFYLQTISNQMGNYHSLSKTEILNQWTKVLVQQELHRETQKVLRERIQPGQEKTLSVKEYVQLLTKQAAETALPESAAISQVIHKRAFELAQNVVHYSNFVAEIQKQEQQIQNVQNNRFEKNTYANAQLVLNYQQEGDVYQSQENVHYQSIQNSEANIHRQGIQNYQEILNRQAEETYEKILNRQTVNVHQEIQNHPMLQSSQLIQNTYVEGAVNRNTHLELNYQQEGDVLNRQENVQHQNVQNHESSTHHQSIQNHESNIHHQSVQNSESNIHRQNIQNYQEILNRQTEETYEKILNRQTVNVHQEIQNHPMLQPSQLIQNIHVEGPLNRNTHLELNYQQEGDVLNLKENVQHQNVQNHESSTHHQSIQNHESNIHHQSVQNSESNIHRQNIQNYQEILNRQTEETYEKTLNRQMVNVHQEIQNHPMLQPSQLIQNIHVEGPLNRNTHLELNYQQEGDVLNLKENVQHQNVQNHESNIHHQSAQNHESNIHHQSVQNSEANIHRQNNQNYQEILNRQTEETYEKILNRQMVNVHQEIQNHPMLQSAQLIQNTHVEGTVNRNTHLELNYQQEGDVHQTQEIHQQQGVLNEQSIHNQQQILKMQGAQNRQELLVQLNTQLQKNEQKIQKLQNIQNYHTVRKQLLYENIIHNYQTAPMTSVIREGGKTILQVHYEQTPQSAMSAPLTIVYNEEGAPEREQKAEIIKLQKQVDEVVRDLRTVEEKTIVRKKEITEHQQEAVKELLRNHPNVWMEGSAQEAIRREVRKNFEQGMPESIERITTKVYRRLEEKLKMERGRRGMS